MCSPARTAEVSNTSQKPFHTTEEKHKVKRRIEVTVRQLCRLDRECFVKAKAKEWTPRLDKDAVETAKNKAGIPRSHTLEARRALTWKSVGAAKEPKARLRVLGYTDPRLTTLETSSPTSTGDREALITQWIANNRYSVESRDLKKAFLSGEVDGSRTGEDAIFGDLRGHAGRCEDFDKA